MQDTELSWRASRVSYAIFIVKTADGSPHPEQTLAPKGAGPEVKGRPKGRVCRMHSECLHFRIVSLHPGRILTKATSENLMRGVSVDSMQCETTVNIRNRLGLHARPASRFAQRASEFESEVWLISDGRAVDGKSILEVLTLACPKGSVLTVRAEGPDADRAVSALKELVATRFGEID